MPIPLSNRSRRTHIRVRQRRDPITSQLEVRVADQRGEVVYRDIGVDKRVHCGEGWKLSWVQRLRGWRPSRGVGGSRGRGGTGVHTESRSGVHPGSMVGVCGESNHWNGRAMLVNINCSGPHAASIDIVVSWLRNRGAYAALWRDRMVCSPRIVVGCC